MVKLRENIAKNDKWRVDALYKTTKDWQAEFDAHFGKNKESYFANLSKFQGKIGESPKTLKSFLELFSASERLTAKLYVYAHLTHDVDIANDEHKTALKKIENILNKFMQETCWFEPELLSLSDNILNEMVSSDELKDYHFFLEKIIRLKKHTLSPEQENIIALSFQALETSSKAFSAINDADFKFGTAEDSKGQEHEITHAKYAVYIRDQDPSLRQSAYKKYHGKYMDFENSLAELLNGNVQKNLFIARARNYASCLESALYPNNISPEIYHSLIEAVNDNLSSLHKYVNLRKKALGLKELHFYDMYVPLIEDVEINLSFDEACEVIIESCSILGPEYQNVLAKGLKEEKWVDRYENKNKRSGAYSSGCYDSYPYILMNYRGLIRDASTLAHEAGHSMHSKLSDKNQPYQYSQYPIFLAEVASTFNEALLNKTMMERVKSKKEKIFLINQQIEDIRATLFRQTLFAEFELFLYKLAENNIPIVPALLKEEYKKLNLKYYGPEIIIDDFIGIEWARIPHFYANFYVYQYATGISAALALNERVINGTDIERDQYLSFLKGGSGKYPLDLLKLAGVDMSKKEPITCAIQKFDRLVDELELALR